MSRIFVSGLLNIECSVNIRQFPVEYYPIDYCFFGVNSCVGGVGFNIAKALSVLGDEVDLSSIIGGDFEGDRIIQELDKESVGHSLVSREMESTPASAVLIDKDGKRRIQCDLKDIQDRRKHLEDGQIPPCHIAVICNINFNREILHQAKALNKTIATDVHCLSDIYDEYNREFMENADILFLSDEALPCEAEEFISQIENTCGNPIIVMGRGSKGALMYVKSENKFYNLPAVYNDNVVNTVGAGDALFSAFIHYYAKGLSPYDALVRAQVFASAKISANGASKGFITEEEIESRLKALRQ